MADTLSGLLAGLNQGVQTGLQLYTAVEGQKRAQRQEELQAARYAVEDQRYADAQERQASRDAEEDDRWDKTFQFNTEKMNASNKIAQDKLRQQMVIAADNSKRGWATVAQGQQRNQLSAARLALEKSKEQRANLKEYVTDVGNAFADPDRGADAAIELLNNSPMHRMAAVTKLQRLGVVGEVPPEVVGRMTIIPAGDGQYAIGVRGENGQVSPYDPDGANGPQKAVTVPQSMLQRAFGGQDAVDAGNAVAALSRGQSTVDRAVNALDKRSQSLSAAADASRQTAETASFEKEFEANGPRAEWLRQHQASTTAEDTWSGAGGTIVRTNPSTGKREVAKVVDGQLQDPLYQEAQQAHQSALAAAEKTLVQSQLDGTAAKAGAETTAERARTLSDTWQTLSRSAAHLPMKERAQAVENATATMAVDPDLAKHYPFKAPKEAIELYTKDRNALVDRLVGAVDLKTQTDDKGKPVALEGGKANLRAVLLSMPKEIQLTLNDYTGQAEGALQKAAQAAVDIGKPEAIIYNLYADKLGIDSKETVALMQDKALWSVKDPAERFKYAVTAMEMVNSGKASSVEAALGKVMMHR